MNHNKLINILVVILVFAMLGTGLLITFTPEFDLKDTLLSMTEAPRNLFHFIWERATGEQETEPTEESAATEPTKVETPIILFDEEETVPPTDALAPIVIQNADGLNELPMDELNHGN